VAILRAPDTQRVAIREISTGQILERWSVDAREIVTMHPEQYEYVRNAVPAVAPPEPNPAPTLVVDIDEELDKLGYKDLQELARRAGVPSGVSKAALVALLKPHVEGGTLSLQRPADVLGAPNITGG